MSLGSSHRHSMAPTKAVRPSSRGNGLPFSIPALVQCVTRWLCCLSNIKILTLKRAPISSTGLYPPLLLLQYEVLYYSPSNHRSSPYLECRPHSQHYVRLCLS